MSKIQFSSFGCTDDIGVGFLVKCKKSALVSSGRRYKESSKLCDDPGDVFVYLANQNAEDTCTIMMSPDRSKRSLSYTILKIIKMYLPFHVCIYFIT